MEKPAAPVRDGGQARAVALRNGAASLPGPPACFPFAKCQGAGDWAPFTTAQYHVLLGMQMKAIFSRRGAESRRVENGGLVHKLLNINGMQF
jgi:hypothetical protein